MKPSGSMRVPVYVAAIMIVLFTVMQLVRPHIENPPVTADLEAPPEVRQILRRSCYNCHSNETHLPWFDRVAPASWLVANDVKEARRHLNFSELGKLSVVQQRATLYEAVNQVQLGAMPLPQYLLIHPHARVSADDLSVLKNHLNPAALPAIADDAAKAIADAQYDKWVHATNTMPAVQPELNGITYLSDYKNWKVVSTTDRFDNHTLRVIFGNDIAIRAIAEHRINPWPDGTIFAKTAWAQQMDANGDTKTGAFLQVEFMIKDSTKYASTKGWGYARWRGMDLKPYGKDASFASECVGCHNPVRNNDYVYSFPLNGQQ